MKKFQIINCFYCLIFRAYCAYQENVQPKPELLAEEKTLLAEYSQKLMFENEVIPDPLLLEKGWIKEKDTNIEASGILKWPSVCYPDIADWVKLTQSDFINRLQSDYKQGKCYRYFENDFVREILFHPITVASKFCILKTKVIPSQRVNSKPYDVWVVLTKDRTDEPGGNIKSSFCSCTAGLGGTCNHIIATLFRVEYAVRFNLTKPASTSLLCSWNVPSGKKVDTQPCKIQDINFFKGKYMKTQNSKEKAQKTTKRFLDFSPLWPNKKKIVENSRTVFDSLKEELYGTCVWEIMEGRSLAAEALVKSNSIACPTLLTLSEEFFSFCMQNNIKPEENYDDFFELIKYDKTQIECLKTKTLRQSENQEWFEHRIGRLTASKFHRIFTRVKTVQKVDTDTARVLCKPLTAEIMGYNKKINTYALKHGLSLEPHAKKYYISLAKKQHNQLNTKESGLIICEEYPYIGASPDLEIECECCGKGLLEIKCPYSVKDCSPNESNLSYLEEKLTNDGTKIECLKKNTNYYFQIQGQMGVTKRKYCDFFVFTSVGYHLERIYFDQNLWEDMLTKLEWFWKTIICHELVFKQIKTNFYSDSLSTQTQKLHVTINDILQQNELVVAIET